MLHHLEVSLHNRESVPPSLCSESRRVACQNGSDPLGSWGIVLGVVGWEAGDRLVPYQGAVCLVNGGLLLCPVVMGP